MVAVCVRVQGQAPTRGKMVRMDGLDCPHPRSVRTGSLNRICGVSSGEENPKMEEALVLIHNTKHTMKAYRCTRIESTFREVCGMWSHSKLYEPPTIMEEALVTQE